MPSNTNDRGYIRLNTSAPCQSEITPANDVIRTGLVNGGASASDIALYDGAASNQWIALKGLNTTAKLTTLRNAMLAAVSGSYRIGNTDAEFNTAPTSNGTNAMAGPSGAALAQGRLQANTAPILVMASTGTLTTGVAHMEPRKGSHAYTTTAATNLAGSFTSWTGPLVSDMDINGGSYVVWVFKKPTFVDAADRNTTFHYTTTMGMTAGTNQIGSTRTTLTTSNTFNRLWQIIAGSPTLWP